MLRSRRALGFWYGTLVVLIVALGAWWTIFLDREGRNYESLQIARLETERLQAAYLIQTAPAVAEDPTGRLGEAYPHLLFERSTGGFTVRIDPGYLEGVRREAARRRRMIVSEGIFFLVLLGAGVTVLTVAFRRERDYDRARELFLAGATHEFKTPLASLRLYTETLSRPDLSAERAATIRARLLEDVARLESLVNQVLALGHDDVGPAPREVLDLAAESRRVIEELAGYAREQRATVETQLEEGHLVRATRLTLHLALVNLVRNAVQHGGDPARVTVLLVRDGRWHRLSVRDRGPGIPRRLHEKIFQCFYRGDSSGAHQGAGIGLYLVARITASLGGRVELESRAGEGSTFTLVLPAWEGDRS
jgi:two-component system phosphate regulon sensor histidine kinase PhoR